MAAILLFMGLSMAAGGARFQAAGCSKTPIRCILITDLCAVE